LCRREKSPNKTGGEEKTTKKKKIAGKKVNKREKGGSKLITPGVRKEGGGAKRSAKLDSCANANKKKDREKRGGFITTE